MTASQFVILGCGYTGMRVARSLASQGALVVATTRDPSKLHLPGVRLLRVEAEEAATVNQLREAIQPAARVLYSVPLIRDAASWRRTVPLLAPALGEAVNRVVYLSTTSVYGATELVDEKTPAAARHPRELLRLQEEADLAAGPWSSLILRPAAIYGADRGVHVAVREGRHKLSSGGSNWISRIHVDDLAALAETALRSDLTGTYPVADDYPCTALEIARFCAESSGVPLSLSAEPLAEQDTRRANRRVDGRAIRAALGIELRFPSYREGIASVIQSA